jgi:hypothetical protein
MRDAGFSQAEMERAALWFEAALRAQEPVTPENYSEHHADEVAAMHGTRWLACRFEHGPEICDLSCVGEYRHRPAWQPRPGGPPGLHDRIMPSWPEWDSEFVEARLAALELTAEPTLLDASEANALVEQGTPEQQARARRIVAKVAATNREKR